jgi:ABC-type antimicrobial peptide transport system permease subunit
MSSSTTSGTWLKSTLPPLEGAGPSSPTAVLRHSVRSALAGLRAYKLRSALTLLGMVVGVASLLLVVTLGQISRDYVEAQWTHVGANLLSIVYNPGPNTSKAVALTRSTLTDADAQAVRRLPHVVAVSPVGYDGLPVVAGPITSGGWPIEAGSPALQTLQNLTIQAGAFFTEQDEAAGAAVAVIGPGVAEHFFPGTSPIGQDLRIGPVNFRVVGVLARTGGNAGDDTTDETIIPFSTYEQRLSGHKPPQILLQVDQSANIPDVMTFVTQTLDQQHHIAYAQASDFAVWYNNASTDPEVQALNLTTLVAGIVAAIALLIGAFGIGSTMFMAIRLRRAEIGLRLAVGAQPADVLRQFLAEAATLSLVGGVIGTLAGCGLAFAFFFAFRDALLGHWFRAAVQSHPLPPPTAIVVALVVSTLIGIGSGYVPARRAASLDPVQALRDD